MVFRGHTCGVKEGFFPDGVEFESSFGICQVNLDLYGFVEAAIS